LAGEHGEVFDDGAKRQRRQEREAADNENHADEKANEEAAMGRERAK
jgi:hypothetical protein